MSVKALLSGALLCALVLVASGAEADEMAKLSIDQVAAAAYQAGFRGDALAEITAIAMAESGGNAQALNPNGEHSVGLTQINMRAHGSRFGGERALYDPVTNMKAAYQLSNGGKNFRPWSVHRSSPSPHAGASQKHLPQARQAASSAQGTQVPSGGNRGAGRGDTSAPRARFDNMPGGGAPPAPDPQVEAEIRSMQDQAAESQKAAEEAQRKAAEEQEAHRQRVLQTMQSMHQQLAQRRQGGGGSAPEVPVHTVDPGQMRLPDSPNLTPRAMRRQSPGSGDVRRSRLAELTGLDLPEPKRREEDNDPLALRR